MSNLPRCFRALGVVLTLAALPLACGDDAPSTDGSAGSAGRAGAAPQAGHGGAAAGASGGEAQAGEGGAPPLAGGGGRDEAGGAAGAAGTGGAGPDALGFGEYCSRMAADYSEFLTRCYGATDYPESERASAIAARTERCLEAEPSLAAGRLRFDEVAAEACLAELEADDTCSPLDYLLRAPACAALFAGQVEPGAECYRDATLYFTVIGAASECRGGFCEGDQCPGRCREWLDDGEDCELGQCAPESACVEGVCGPRRAQDEPCERQEDCALGLACVGNVCRVPSRDGDPCHGELCSTGYNCIAGECWAKVEAGEVCTWRYDCSDDGRCLDRDGDGPEGLTCGPLGELGEGCAQPSDCGPDFYCAREGNMPGTCERRDPVSAACNGDSCVEGAWCNVSAGVCQAAGEEGDDCMQGTQPGPKAACAGELFCMNDGQCRPAGDVGGPCLVRDSGSCVEGTFCSRDGAVCVELAELGDYCNPLLPQPCEGELGCLCTGEACDATIAPSEEHDTLFTCAPRREVGEECFGEYECAGESWCGVGESGSFCQPGSFCLP